MSHYSGHELWNETWNENTVFSEYLMLSEKEINLFLEFEKGVWNWIELVFVRYNPTRQNISLVIFTDSKHYLILFREQCILSR